MRLTDRFTTSRTLLDRLCRENGWDIDIREDDAIALYFNGDGGTDRRMLIVMHKDGEPAMTFACSLCSSIPANRLPAHIPVTLLARNHSKMAGWHVSDRNGQLLFSCGYVALADSITAHNFKVICTMLLKEVATVEAYLRHERVI